MAWRRLRILTALAAVLAAAPAAGPATPPPRLVLWAWERPEDLRFADPAIAIAVLAGTIRIEADSVSLRPRLQPARLRPDQPVIGVVHMEIPYAIHPAWTAAQRARVAAGVRALLADPRFQAWQIDFEVRASQRAILRDVLADARLALPPGRSLSMTALASWCDTETWIDAAPVDRVVPMLFRMGPAGAPILRRLAQGGHLRDRHCRDAIGIAADTPPRALPPGRQIWVFNPRPWTQAGLAALRQRLHL